MSIFQKYADYYDILYKNKNYLGGEKQYILFAFFIKGLIKLVNIFI